MLATRNPREWCKEASKKRDYKALFLLYQCVYEVIFENISFAKSAKEAWEISNQAHGGDGKGKNREKGISVSQRIEKEDQIKPSESGSPDSRLHREGFLEQQ